MKAVFLRHSGYANGSGDMSGEITDTDATLYLEDVEVDTTSLRIDLGPALTVDLTGLELEDIKELEDLFSTVRYNWPSEKQDADA